MDEPASPSAPDPAAPGARSSVVVRPAVPSDLPALRLVFRRSAWSNPGDRPLLGEHPELLEWPDQALGEGRTRAAVISDRLVGFASTLAGGEVVELEDLFVDPDWMEKGVGRALVEDLAGAAAAAGRRRIEVDANPHALAFYARVGFVSDGEVDVAYGTGIRMHLDVRI